MIYLDNAATTKMCEASIEAFSYANEHFFANSVSYHEAGFKSEQMIKSAKKFFGNLLNTDDSNIIFTSGATESNSYAIIGLALKKQKSGKKIVSTTIEHPSVLNSLKYLQTLGFDVTYISPDKDGNIPPLSIANAIDDKTILVTVMHVNNETGLILPIEEIAKVVKLKNKNTAFHVDAVQSFMKLPIDLKKTNIDLLTISGHKLYSPKGIGILYKKNEINLTPLLYGANQQSGLRSGTECNQLVYSFHKAIEYIAQNKTTINQTYKTLKNHLLKSVKTLNSKYDDEKVTINSTDNSIDSIINISVLNIPSQVMLHHLEKDKIYVSAGSACAKNKGSAVLNELNVDLAASKSAIRISLSYHNTISDIDSLISSIKTAIDTLHKTK